MLDQRKTFMRALQPAADSATLNDKIVLRNKRGKIRGASRGVRYVTRRTYERYVNLRARRAGERN